MTTSTLDHAFVSPEEWAAVCDLIETRAADYSSLILPSDGLGVVNMLKSYEGSNTINGLFHHGVVASFDSFGGKKAKGYHDINLFGHHGEIKTASNIGISTNKSYVDTDPSELRLLLAINFAIFDNRRIHVWLVRQGWVGPNDYEALSEKSQIATLRAESYSKLFAIVDFDTEDFPAIVVRDCGPVTAEMANNAQTVRDLRRYIFSHGKHDDRWNRMLDDMTPEALAERCLWLTAGQVAPLQRKGPGSVAS
jgi:hypothetical protein